MAVELAWDLFAAWGQWRQRACRRWGWRRPLFGGGCEHALHLGIAPHGGEIAIHRRLGQAARRLRIGAALQPPSIATAPALSPVKASTQARL